MDLVRELESYNGDASNLVMSRSISKSRSSGSSDSDSLRAGPSASGSRYPPGTPAHLLNNQSNPQPMQREIYSENETSEDDDEVDDQLPAQSLAPSAYAAGHLNRPQSSASVHRYRTPMASMLLSPPPVSMSVPPSQPRPQYETPSAYAGHVTPQIPAPSYPPMTSYSGEYPQSSRTDLVSSPPTQYPMQPLYRSTSRQQFSRPFPLHGSAAGQQSEHDDMQLRIRVLEERLERLEFTLPRSTSSLLSNGRGRSPRGAMSPHGVADGPWDVEHMGMWAVVLNPLSSLLARFRQLMEFLAYNPDRSPGLLVVRRLFLDISFFLCLLALVKLSWRRSGVRRKEVLHALRGVWWAIVGRRPPKILLDKAV